MNSNSIAKVRSAKVKYQEMVRQFEIYTGTLLANSANLSEENRNRIGSVCRVIDDMIIDIRSRGLDDAGKRNEQYGDIKLYEDATLVLEALYQGITDPKQNSAQEFYNHANHFKKQHLGNVQSNILFDARILACLAVINLVCACILCFTPLAPLALFNLATVACSSYSALYAYNISASYDQVTNNTVTAMMNTISLNTPAIIDKNAHSSAIKSVHKFKAENNSIRNSTMAPETTQPKKTDSDKPFLSLRGK